MSIGLKADLRTPFLCYPLGVAHRRFYRRCTIGIKTSLIGFERASGCDRFGGGFSGTEQREDLLPVQCREDRESSGSVPDGGVLGGGPGDCGSAALGLSECDMLGFEPKSLECCSYSRFVCAGFSARIERVRQRGNKKGIAPATP